MAAVNMPQEATTVPEWNQYPQLTCHNGPLLDLNETNTHSWHATMGYYWTRMRPIPTVDMPQWATTVPEWDQCPQLTCLNGPQLEQNETNTHSWHASMGHNSSRMKPMPTVDMPQRATTVPEWDQCPQLTCLNGPLLEQNETNAHSWHATMGHNCTRMRPIPTIDMPQWATTGAEWNQRQQPLVEWHAGCHGSIPSSLQQSRLYFNMPVA